MKSKGFTLIEFMIVIAIIIILGTAFVGGITSRNSDISFGINGMTESRCISGYQFVIGGDGQARQVLDEFGKGVRCEQRK